jgi:hypothetical protein
MVDLIRMRCILIIQSIHLLRISALSVLAGFEAPAQRFCFYHCKFSHGNPIASSECQEWSEEQGEYERHRRLLENKLEASGQSGCKGQADRPDSWGDLLP